MIDPRSWAAQSLGMTTHFSEAELEQRLGLYRVFLRLYEHHQGLLNEILDLENFGGSHPHKLALQYVQGVVSDEQVHLVTNLIPGETQALLQPQQIWVVGRDRQAAISIQDERLSRRHAAIRYVVDQGFYLVDLDSTNGSFINSERVWGCTLLKEGDRVRLGSLTFTFFICQTAQMIGAVPASVLEQMNRVCAYEGSEVCRVTATESEAEISPDQNDSSSAPEISSTIGFLQSHLSDAKLPDPDPTPDPHQPSGLLKQLLSQAPKLSNCN